MSTWEDRTGRKVSMFKVFRTRPSMFATNWDHVADFETLDDAKLFAENGMYATGDDYYVRDEDDTETLYSVINW